MSSNIEKQKHIIAWSFQGNCFSTCWQCATFVGLIFVALLLGIGWVVIVRILQRYLGLRVDIKERMGHIKEKKGELSTFSRQSAVLSISYVKRRFRYRWWWLKGSRKKMLMACCVVAWMCRDNEIIQWQSTNTEKVGGVWGRVAG